MLQILQPVQALQPRLKNSVHFPQFLRPSRGRHMAHFLKMTMVEWRAWKRHTRT